MIPELAAALSALNGIRQTAEHLVDVRDTNKLGEVKAALIAQFIEASERVLDLQHALANQRDEIRDLKDEIRTLKAAAEDRGRYKLAQVGNERSYVYAAANLEETGEPAHWVCQPCYDAGKKAVMQSRTLSGGRAMLKCPINADHNLIL